MVWSLDKFDLVAVGDGGGRENRCENHTTANRGKWRRMMVIAG
jgi:hypothetical protein